MEHCHQEIKFLDKMDFGLAVTSSIEVKNTHIITELSDEMKSHFNDKNYGNDIKSYTIGVICVSPQFDFFYKEKKPKYTKGKKVISPDGILFTLEDNFEYNIKLDFEEFQNSSEEERKKIIAREILSSIDIINTIKKIKDFDTEKFKSDLEVYFKQEGLY